MPPTYDEFFAAAFPDGRRPYDYQRRLAEDACVSRLIDVPTGLGKTAAVVLAWLWNRVHEKSESWPRRLVYCLPMRTLVEQTRDEARGWVNRLADAGLITTKPRIVVLMGGEILDEDEREWDIHPEADTILIGTQDMLLSRALNRGYGMSRARWPMHFGMLNNDCLWVMDETQLMGVGVRTSAQLEGLRRKLGLAAGSYTWWASATLDSRLLETPDHHSLPQELALSEVDRRDNSVLARIRSEKHLTVLPVVLSADTSEAKSIYCDALAQLVIGKHVPGTLTLVILNRVDRASGLYAALDKLSQKQAIPARLLVHSRFRLMEREGLTKAMKEPGEKILIATQAIEAGVDISSRVLITELAPWSSLVQRFGRCNRSGEFNSNGGAEICWIDLSARDEKAAEALSLPYTPEQIATARQLILQAGEGEGGASPEALAKLRSDEPIPESHILRRKDLVDLFDTTPDLAGLDIDVGRYIRDGDERDVQVFWRDIAKDAKTPDETIVAQRVELVRVSADRFKKFAEKNKGSVWVWDTLEGKWQEFRDTYRIPPGRIFLVDLACGGYSETLGWTGEKTKESFRVLTSDDQIPARIVAPRDGQGNDDESQTCFQSLSEHTGHVVEACRSLLGLLPPEIKERWGDVLLEAALWHDVGKAHPCFQKYLTADRDIPSEYQGEILAKSSWKPHVRSKRRHFRHELASMLAWLQAGQRADTITQNLVAWLIVTHHGKIRLSLRAMPGESVPTDEEKHAQSERLYARGVWDGDDLTPPTDRRIGLQGVPEIFPPLDLSLMRMGGSEDSPSWTSRGISLRDSPELGMFRLAWLEAVLRAADALGSQK